jgi:hypothetical protein
MTCQRRSASAKSPGPSPSRHGCPACHEKASPCLGDRVRLVAMP